MKEMREQFRIFITEPFGNKKIGKGEGPWAILLDGLDECEGVDEQCRVVRLVSEFVLKFPNAALIWAISSRPEPHIVATFTNVAVAPSHWSEYIPINSTEACQDVERYLLTSFEGMRERYPYLPSNWPSETQSLKLANGAKGLFVFARTAVRYMEDSNYADPVSRLDLLVSVIDRLDVEVTDEHPFALLDALYNHIFALILPSVWRTTKRGLEFVICTQSGDSEGGLSYPLKSRSLLGASIILGLERSVIYGSLHKLHSVLEVPDPKDVHKSGVSFLHASFGDYLTDSTRSKDFYIDRGESVDDITRSLFKLYLAKPWDSEWAQYASQLSTTIGSTFSRDLREDAKASVYYIVSGALRSQRGRGPFKNRQDRLECLDALRKINLSEAYAFDGSGGKTMSFLLNLWNGFREELVSDGQFEQVPLRDLKVDRLDHRRSSPACLNPTNGQIMWPDNFYTAQDIYSELRILQRRIPENCALICGSSPEKRVALFPRLAAFETYYCFPYPS